MEIGAGGSLLALLLNELSDISSYDIIDLDFVIPQGFVVLSHFAPDVQIQLPGEQNNSKNLFKFHLPHSYCQKNNDVDLIINITSIFN